MLTPLPREPHRLVCGYVDDARRLEAAGRSWAVGGSDCVLEVADDVVCADAMWTLAGISFLAWLLSEGT